MGKSRIVVLTGAGISAESGISTFRDSGGLWEGHNIQEVASPEGWYKNPSLVREFYNKRRMQLAGVKPNLAHLELARLETKFDVSIITQNVDDLHERAGSAKILHLHGELIYLCETGNRAHREFIGYNQQTQNMRSSNGKELRPDIVWFGEEVPKMDEAVELTSAADILMVIGTSLEVYPAAGLIQVPGQHVPIYLVDLNRHSGKFSEQTKVYNRSATDAVPEIVEQLLGT